MKRAVVMKTVDGEPLFGRTHPPAIVTLKSEWEWASLMMMMMMTPYPTRQKKKNPIQLESSSATEMDILTAKGYLLTPR